MPRLGEGDVLVELRACGLCGTDLHKLAHGTAEPGAVLGHEVAATVVEVRGRVEDRHGKPLRPGSRIVAPHHVSCGACVYCERGSETMCDVFRENLLDPGGFAETFAVRARAVRHAAFEIPTELADEAALFLEPAACVVRGVRRSGIGEGQAVAVAGAGSTGLLHLLVLRALFRDLRVDVVDPVPERRELARVLGADGAWHPDEASDALRKATGGLGVDVVFDTAGGAAVLGATLDWSRRGSTCVLFAHAPAGDSGALRLDSFFREERRIVPSYSGGRTEQEIVWRLLVDGRLDPRPLITGRYPLSRLADAVEAARTRREIKVLIEPEPKERLDEGEP